MARNRGEGSVRPDGRQFRFSYRGRKYQGATAEVLNMPPHRVTYRHGLRALQQQMAEVKAGRVVSTPHMTLTEVLDAYEQDLVLRDRRSVRGVKCTLAHARDAFGPDRVLDVTEKRIAVWAAQMKDQEINAGSRHLRLGYLRTALRFAKRKGWLAVVPEIPMPTLNNVRQDFFTQEEYERILFELPALLRPYIRFLHATGWRSGEAKAMLWDWVDWQAGMIRVPMTKNGAGRAVPFVDGRGQLLPHGRILNEMWDEHQREGSSCPWVFHRQGHPIKSYYKAWDGACARLGMPDKLVHGLRRTASRDMVERAELDYKTAMGVTGHRSLSTFMRYQISDARSVQRGFTKLAQYRDALPSGNVEPLRRQQQRGA